MKRTMSTWRSHLTASFITCTLLFGFAAEAEQNGGQSSAFGGNPFANISVPETESDEERAELAERHTLLGRNLLHDHEYEEAARNLELAYRLGGDPHIFYDLADALRRMGRYVAAAERLRTDIERVGAELTPQQLGEVELEVQQLRALYAAVSVTTNPEGASVLLGQRIVGVTPLARPMMLNNGHYQLRIRLEGYRDVAEELVVAGGRAVERSFDLEPIAAQGNPRRLGLDVALWINFALSIVSVGALAITAIGASNRYADCFGADGDCSSGSLAEYESMSNATWALTGVASATGIAALVLGIVRLSGGDSDENE